MMGVQFAQHLLAFAQSKGLAVGTIAKIESNPDQSKHLETARFTVYGIEMDLVNLRSEEYAANSRIPTQVVGQFLDDIPSAKLIDWALQTFGTPLQDALRRDITINALFFNVHSRSVEDLTEKVGKHLFDMTCCLIAASAGTLRSEHRCNTNTTVSKRNFHG